MATTPGEVKFQQAKPVWAEGRERVINDFLGFRTVVPAKVKDPIRLRLTSSSPYRATVNGQFLGHGPVRAAHGFFRIDEWDVTPLLAKEGDSVVAIEVTGYNADSYYTLDQPSFLQAEVADAGGKILAATSDGPSAFVAVDVPEKLRKVERYSWQRTFSEVYRIAAGWDAWRSEVALGRPVVPLSVQPGGKLIARGIDVPRFELTKPALVARGVAEKRDRKDGPHKMWGLTGINDKHKGYPENELETIPSIEMFYYQYPTRVEQKDVPATPIELKANEYAIYDLGRNLSGFIGAKLKTDGPARVVFMFDEILNKDGQVDAWRLGCANFLLYELKNAGEYPVECIEPYTMKYLKVVVLEGDVRLDDLYLREYASPMGRQASVKASDARLEPIFTAAVQTIRQNAADLFMDCPSRERAGWLCDSFWTARVALDLAGHTRDERNFLENFLLPERFAHLPEGMLAMCYPADHTNENFIPQWAMWFVVQLEEYLARSGDRQLVDALEQRVRALLTYFKGFENSDGLLENLVGWRFVEWSKANEFVDGVNYPTNALYSAVLDAVGRMYGDESLTKRATQVRETVAKQSFDGTFFIDQAKRDEAKALKPTTNRTEVCQYYLFYFNVATPQSHAALWKTLTTDFGPQRKQTRAHPEIHPANAFIGNYLRLELLSRYGLQTQLREEISGYFAMMAETTGTLWENDTPHASCNHGFASHVAHWIYRDLLGARPDARNKVLTLTLRDSGLTDCEGTIAAGEGGWAHVHWKRAGDEIAWSAIAPEGWRVELQNKTGLKAVKRGEW